MPDEEINIQELTQAFKLTTEAVEVLGPKVEKLMAKVAQLTEELSAKNSELEQKVYEVDALRNTLATILESLTDGVVACDAEGCITAINPAAAFTLAVNEVDALAQPAASVFGEGATAVEKILQQARQGDQAQVNVEVVVVGLTGERILAVSGAPLLDEQGNTAGAVVSFRDLTDMKHLEADMRRKDRLAAVGEMAAAMSHEIRNPIGGIKLYTSLLERSLKDRPEDAELAGKIMSGVDILNKTVQDLLDFTRDLTPDCKQVDVCDILDNAIATAAAEIKQRRVTIKKTYTDNAQLSADPHLLGRMFVNMIQNAAQASPEDGCVELSITRQDQHLIIRVTDSGQGIEPEDLPRLFMPFFTKKANGTGLGLAIVRRIAEVHNGTIHASNNNPQPGATFEVSLPQRPKAAMTLRSKMD